MNEKSLLTKVGEVIDAHRAARLALDADRVNTSQKWPTKLKWLLPAPGSVIFTLLVIGGLLWGQSIGALPLGAPLTAATSTSSIPYQGRLADGAGTPLTGTFNMIFRLYSAVAGGTPLWEEQWTGPNSVQVSDGLFNVMLGSVTPIPQNVLNDNSNLFLGITVGTDSEMVPRVQLGTVPYAVQALTVPDGSITAAKLASDVSLIPPDGSITSAKLALQHGSTCLSQQTAVAITGNSQYTPVPNMTFPITMNAAGNVLIWTNGMYRFDTSAFVAVALYLDNSLVANMGQFNTGVMDDFILIRNISVPQGTHTISLHATAQQAGPVTFEGGQERETCLEYIVLP